MKLSKQLTEEDDQEEFLEILSRTDCRNIPKAEEVRPTLLCIAHKELIQEPKYELDAIAATARNYLQLYFSTEDAIVELYEKKQPTVRKVLKLIHSSPSNQGQDSALSYLKQYIRI